MPRRPRDWKGSVRAKNGWFLVTVKNARGKWIERSTGLRASPENLDAARSHLAARRAAWTPAQPPGEYRGHWRNSLNKSFKRRRGCACEVCGWTPRPPLRPSAVNVHHVKPRSEGGPHSDENRVVLCPNHHAVAHALHRASPAKGRDELLAQIRAWDEAAIR